MAFWTARYRSFIRFDSNSDQFWHLAWLHQLLGFNLVNPYAVRIWKMSLVLAIAQALCFSYRLYMVIMKGQGFSYAVCCLMVLGGFVSGGVRYSGFAHFYDDFCQLRTSLRQCMVFQRDDDRAQIIRREHYENNQKFTLFMASAGLMAISVWNFTDYRLTDHYRIPFEMSFLSPMQKAIFETCYGFYLLVLALYFWIPFITIRVVLRRLHAELLVVNGAYATLIREALSSCDFLFNHVANTSMDDVKSKLFWLCLEDELRRIVTQHKIILINVNRIRRLASIPFLAETFASVSIGSIAVFLLMLLREESLVLVGIACIVMLESYYNSLLVEELEDVHSGTKDVLYGLEWPVALKYDQMYCRQYTNVRKNLLIVMMRSQQRLKFHCGGLFDMCMDTFMATVRTCYTILTFLMQVKGF